MPPKLSPLLQKMRPFLRGKRFPCARFPLKLAMAQERRNLHGKGAALLLSFLPFSSLLLPSCAWSTDVYRIITCPLTQGNLVFEGEASLYPLEDGEVWGLKLSPRKYYGLKVRSRLRGDKDPQGVLDRSFALDKVVRVHPGNVFEVEWDAPAIGQGVLAFDVFGVKGTFGIGDWDETGAWPGGVNFLYGAIFVQDGSREAFKSKVLELDPSMEWDTVPDL